MIVEIFDPLAERMIISGSKEAALIQSKMIGGAGFGIRDDRNDAAGEGLNSSDRFTLGI